MAKVLNRSTVPARGLSSELNVVVVFTSVQATVTALKKAGMLANQLGGRIQLLVPQVVSYALPLSQPPVPVNWTERRVRVIADESPIETAVQILLCRDVFSALTAVLEPGSVIVIGGQKRWWVGREERLARRLTRAGHEVIFAARK